MESDKLIDGKTSQIAANEHETVLRNLELATKIFNANLEQQNAVAHQQAMSQLRVAAIGKCAELILAIDPHAENAAELLREYRSLLDLFEQKFR